ncbi:hypothetical protein B0H19DRAFT_48506 [Mycena capillaripes]|nr:hypothetical protein B0H19DRAFT_48506 [Mycena capillaripes]
MLCWRYKYGRLPAIQPIASLPSSTTSLSFIPHSLPCPPSPAPSQSSCSPPLPSPAPSPAAAISPVRRRQHDVHDRRSRRHAAEGPPYPQGVTDKWLADCCAKDPSTANHMSPASFNAVKPVDHSGTPNESTTLGKQSNGHPTSHFNAMYPNSPEDAKVGESTGNSMRIGDSTLGVSTPRISVTHNTVGASKGQTTTPNDNAAVSAPAPNNAAVSGQGSTSVPADNASVSAPAANNAAVSGQASTSAPADNASVSAPAPNNAAVSGQASTPAPADNASVSAPAPNNAAVSGQGSTSAPADNASVSAPAPNNAAVSGQGSTSAPADNASVSAPAPNNAAVSGQGSTPPPSNNVQEPTTPSAPKLASVVDVNKVVGEADKCPCAAQ